MKKENLSSYTLLPFNYTILWIIVSILSIFVFVSYAIYGIGLGRWECIEYSEEIYITECTEGDIIKTFEGNYDNQPYTCRSKERCMGELKTEKIEPICLKEAWINILEQG